MKSRAVIYFQALRAPFFITSILPVLFGGVLGLNYNGVVKWGLVPVVILGVLSIHGAANLANEYFDFKRGIDKKENCSMEHVLAYGLINPRAVSLMIWICMIVAAVSGLIISMVRGSHILIIGALGAIGGYFYTAPPVEYKYRALGDVMVFILMGPMLILGSSMALTGSAHPEIIIMSIPFAMFITAVLQSNNIRDFDKDKQAGVRTLAGLIGLNNAKLLFGLLLLAPYFVIILLMFNRILPYYSSVVFISLPQAFKNIAIVARPKDAIEIIDLNTVKQYLFFGILLIISLIIKIFCRV